MVQYRQGFEILSALGRVYAYLPVVAHKPAAQGRILAIIISILIDIFNLQHPLKEGAMNLSLIP